MLAMMESGIFFYVLAVLAGIGVITKFIAAIRYGRLERQAEDVPATKDSYIKLWKNKFENAYRINKGMDDAGLFVERCVNQCRLMGIPLNGWDRVNRVLCGGCLLMGTVLITLGERVGADTALIVEYLLTTLSVCGVMLFVEFFCETGDRRQRIGLNLEDYFVNTLSARLRLSAETVTAEPESARGPSGDFRQESRERTRREEFCRDEMRRDTARDSLKESLERIAASREPESDGQREKRSRREEDVRLIEDILREYLK